MSKKEEADKVAANITEILSEKTFNFSPNFDYSTLSKDEFVKHITRFVANLWQVHAFGEGNTRTTAVFIIKYLEKFFRNLILGEQNELRNRYCHVLYSEISGNTATANATVNIKKNMKKLQDEGVCENQQK